MSILIVVVVVVLGFIALAGLLVVLDRRRPEATAHALRPILREGMDAQVILGSEQLDGKKELIDRELGAVRAEIERMQQLVRDLERDGAEKFGQVSTQLHEAGRQTQILTETTQSLREALSSTKARGQWGERMAEDVLRLAGFVENINYQKHTAIEGGGVPDFTFVLPQGLCLHMDVKFPLDNYVRYLESESDIERERHRKDFLRDVRRRLKELTQRDYVDVGTGTVDCVLMFIPNEQVYGFIQEQDAGILDDALRSKVVLCSPLTLFAVLAVVRQAVDNFRLAQTSKEILGLLHGFEKQWGKFVDQMDKVGRGIKTVSHAYDELDGTRRRGLERQLDKITDLRQNELAAVEDDEDDERPFALEA